jgi:competence protein ComEA
MARAAVAVLGLVVLAAIGRSALAGGASKPIETVAEPRTPDPLVPPPAAHSATTPTGAALAGGPAAEVPSSSPLPVASVLDAGEAAPRGRATPDDPVFLNQATLADLRRLPGVGDKRARAILALRDRLQHFQQIEDLLKVKGIGRTSLKKLRPLVRLDLLALPEHPSDAGAMPQPP